MEKLNELEMLSKFADKEVTWSLLPFDLSKEGWCVEVVDYIAAASPATILAIAESFRALEKEVQKNLEGALAWQQRAEAAEAKLAELEKQEPVAYTDEEELKVMRQGTYADMFTPHDSYKLDPQWIPLFTRPAPAINLADMLEVSANKTADEIFHLFDGIYDDRSRAWLLANAVWDACHVAILRNIEGAK